MTEPQPTDYLKTAALGFFLSLIFGFALPNLLTFQISLEDRGSEYGLPSLASAIFSKLDLQTPSEEIFRNWVVALSSTLLIPIVLATAKLTNLRTSFFPSNLRFSVVFYFSFLTILAGMCSYVVLRFILGELGLQSNIGNVFDYQIAVATEGDKFPQISLLWFLPVFLVAPIYEELVFRGLMVKSLKHILPNGVVCVITACVFAAAHWEHFADPSQMIVFVIGGILFFWAREISAGLGLPILLHILWNFCTTTFYWHYTGQ